MGKKTGCQTKESKEKMIQTKLSTKPCVCLKCGEKVFGGIEGLAKHGDEKHPECYFSPITRRFNLKNYYNPINEQWYANVRALSQSLTKLNIPKEEYWNQYGKEFLPDVWGRNMDPVVGESHNLPECKQCGKKKEFSSGAREGFRYPAFCSFSCSTTWYAANTNRCEVAMETLKKRQEDDPNLQLRPNQKQYWLNKGLSEDEAKEKVKERQSTNTQERFMERYGEEEGLKKWFDRQEKWLGSMKESGMFSGTSEVSDNLFEKINQSFGNLRYGNDELTIRLTKGWCKVDCLNPENNKVIEFYGDYWHGNPKKYKPDDVIKTGSKNQIIVKDKWEHDRIRINQLKEKGYDVMIIWESEYRENPDLIIGKCIGFLSAQKSSNIGRKTKSEGLFEISY